MISTARFHRVLLSMFAVVLALQGCDSGSDGGAAGSGGSGGGSGGTGGSGVLRILVTNDDGVGAPGIDAVVEALRTDPNNDIIVSAPAENQSGGADRTSPPPLQAMDAMTASGYPATAVDGFPADSVLYALDNLYPDAPPHVVLSGINAGQNIGNVGGAISQISGTVGAAKTAACLGVPALASSQGFGAFDTYDFPSGVAAVQAWLESNRAALLAGTAPFDNLTNITSINIPTCETGSIRGTVEVALGTENPQGLVLAGPQDCESTLENPSDDIVGFLNGYITSTPVPRNSNMTCDKLGP